MQHPVITGAPILTPNRLAKGMKVGPSDGEEQTQPCIGAATPTRPAWNSQGRLATATKASRRGRHPQIFKSRRSLKENLTPHLSAGGRKKIKQANLLCNAISNHCYAVCDDVVCPSSYRGALSSL